MSALAHDHPAACRNCGAALAGVPAPSFCPSCGQETTLHAPTLAEFAHEFVGHFVAVEGTLWRTLRLLFAAPGRLTTEYFAGRRRRYVAPLRLYLSASFVFFLAVKIAIASGVMPLVIGPIDRHGHPITAASDPVAYRQTQDQLRRCVDGVTACPWYERFTSRIGLKGMQLSDRTDAVSEHLLGMAPYALFILLPLFAAVVMLAYRSRRMAYGAHFVFALHDYSFALLVLAAGAVLPLAGGLAGVAVLIYIVWSMRAVYGGRWWPTLLRFAVVALLFGAALLVAIVVLSTASIMAT